MCHQQRPLAGSSICWLIWVLAFILLPIHSHNQTVKFRRMYDYFYSTISTPNFPHEFDTPYEKYYWINLEQIRELEPSFPKNPVLNIYFTEFFVSAKNMEIFDGGNGKGKIAGWNTKLIPVRNDVNGTEIQVKINNLYTDPHLRTTLHFHQVFGFNISLEIVDKKVEPAKWICSTQNCSFAGHCKSFLGRKRLEFRCECLKGYSGRNCQYGPKCDPGRNINFCLNGGTCSVFGFGGGNCRCPPDYTGPKCQYPIKKINFVSDNQNCTSSDVYKNLRPCSTCTGKHSTPQKGFERYLLRYRDTMNNTEVENEIHRIFNKFVRTRLTNSIGHYIDELYGEKKPFHLPQNQIFILPATPEHALNNATLLKPRIEMNKEKEAPLVVGSEFSLTCYAKIPQGTSASFIQFRWFKDHAPIHREFTTSNRFISIFEEEIGNLKHSVLMIDNVSPFDMGVFTCQVTDFRTNRQECVDYLMRVVVPPQVAVAPMYMTIVKNESGIVVCSDDLEALQSGSHSSLQMAWYQNNEPVGLSQLYATENMTYNNGAILRILRAQESTTFVCRGSNKAGTREWAVKVSVVGSRVNPQESCQETCEKIENTNSTLIWNLTAIGQTAMIHCPNGFVGFAQRRCVLGPNDYGMWMKSDFSRCTHKRIQRFNYTLHAMRNGYSVGFDELSVLHKELNQYLLKRRSSSNKLLYGEGDKFIRMLDDTISYVLELFQTASEVVNWENVQGLFQAADNFLQFHHSCAHESSVFEFVQQLVKFSERVNVRNWAGEKIRISTKPLIFGNLSLIQLIEHKTSRLLINCTSMVKVDEDKNKPRYFTLTSLTDIKYLQSNNSLRSDVVNVQKHNLCLNDASMFEIQFLVNDTKRKLTCGAMDGKEWSTNACKIKLNSSYVSCFCSSFGRTYAVLEMPADEPLPPKASKFIQLPPEWIAASGCIVCIVLCLRTFTRGILKKKYCLYFILITFGIFITQFCLLYFILKGKSRTVELLYMMVTLLMQALRIWRTFWIYNFHDNYPWLEKVSKWTLLMVLIFSEILPLFTIYLVDTIYTDNEQVLHQGSPVFLTFAIVLFISTVTILFLHYKTYLKVHRKNTENNNSTREHKKLNENLANSLIHLIQILFVILYVNLKQHIVLHYMLALTCCIMGLMWRCPKRSLQKRQPTSGNFGDELSPIAPQTSQLPNNGPLHTSLSSIQSSVQTYNQSCDSHNSVSCHQRPMTHGQRHRRLTTSTIVGDDITDHATTTKETIVTGSRSTINGHHSNGEGKMRQDRPRNIPGYLHKVRCELIQDDHDYVQPTAKEKSFSSNMDKV